MYVFFARIKNKNKDKIAAESFSFDPEKITRLKKLATEDGAIKSCTRFAALTALVYYGG